MSDIGSAMGKCLTIFALITILSQIVSSVVHDCDYKSGHSDHYHHKGFGRPSYGLYRGGPQHGGFGFPHRGFGPPPHHWDGPKYGLPSYNSPHRGYGYDRPKPSWDDYNNYPNSNNFFTRRTQDDDYWIFPDTEDRFPPRPTFPSPTTFTPSPTFSPPPVTSPPVTSSPQTTTTISARVQDCIRSCPVTSEYNPVCGTNNVTYTNRGRLECAQFCGVDVQVRRASPCPLPTPAPVNSSIGTSSNPIIPSVQPTVPPTPETTTEFEFSVDERIKDQ